MSYHNAANQILLLKLTRDASLAIGVSDTEWNAKPSDKVSLNVWFDHKRIFAGPAIVLSKDVFSFVIQDSKQTLTDLRMSRAILLKSPGSQLFLSWTVPMTP